MALRVVVLGFKISRWKRNIPVYKVLNAEGDTSFTTSVMSCRQSYICIQTNKWLFLISLNIIQFNTSPVLGLTKRFGVNFRPKILTTQFLLDDSHSVPILTPQFSFTNSHFISILTPPFSLPNFQPISVPAIINL